MPPRAVTHDHLVAQVRQLSGLVQQLQARVVQLEHQASRHKRLILCVSNVNSCLLLFVPPMVFAGRRPAWLAAQTLPPMRQTPQLLVAVLFMFEFVQTSCTQHRTVPSLTLSQVARPVVHHVPRGSQSTRVRPLSYLLGYCSQLLGLAWPLGLRFGGPMVLD